MIQEISHINIEPTNRCNLSCKFCTRSPLLRPNTDMTMELYDEILRQIDASKHCSKSTELRFFLSGEPLLHIDLTTMIAKATRRGYWKSMLHTNATLLTIDKAEELIDAGLGYLSMSFDGIGKKEYEAARVGANFEQTKENIIRCTALARGTKMKTVVQAIVPVGVGTEFINMKLREMFPNSNNYYVRHPHNWNRPAGAVEGAKDYHLPPGVCMFVDYFFPIYADGSVPMCCADLNGDYIAGHVLDNAIDRIWSTKFEECRKKMQRLQVVDSCRNCERYGL